MRFNKVAKELNVGLKTLAETLQKRTGVAVEANPNANITDEQYQILCSEFNRQTKNDNLV